MEETREETCSLTAFKAPAFCNQDPKMWFDILEVMFKSNNIKKSGTRFSHTTGLLPTDVLCNVSDVISRLGDSDTPYEVLKNAILERSQ
ncbi:Tick transposon [Caligus rogercresseyi]|uniref:Tick transposon n=1 Tax=Caligus rogercresseyi TaxID=217165 RepID=A0A7T8JXM3_CALRO|nr:Tick transposon [Caligus rogercresseyi]